MKERNLLFGIDVAEWLRLTISRMERLGAVGRQDWNRSWLESYRTLGGRTSCGEKPCPRAAAYGLWRIGALSGRYNQGLWPPEKVLAELGKNAFYAVLVLDELADSRSESLPELWAGIQHRARRFHVEPARSEQGEIRLVLGLYASGLFPASANGTKTTSVVGCSDVDDCKGG